MTLLPEDLESFYAVATEDLDMWPVEPGELFCSRPLALQDMGFSATIKALEANGLIYKNHNHDYLYTFEGVQLYKLLCL